MATPDTLYVRQYTDTITLLAQQLNSYLFNTVMVDTDFQGEKKFYEQYNTDDFVAVMTRYAPTPIQLPDHRRRMVTPAFFVSNTIEDPVDKLQQRIDPKSAYMQAKQASANRKMDDIIIASFNATAYTGKDGTGTATFTAANQIAYGSVGMTKLKCLNAKRLLDKAEVDVEDRFMVHGSYQVAELLNTTEATSSDFNVIKALVEGTLEGATWIGFKWVRTERLKTDTNSSRLCYAYQKKAIQLAIQQLPQGRITERPDYNYAWQVWMMLCMGATRLEEARIVEIACAESSLG